MGLEPEYGARLSDEEYESRILSLYRTLPPMPSPDQDRGVRLQELNLVIDQRLGRGFPEERRSALWEIQQRVEKRRFHLEMKYLLRRLVARFFVSDARSLAGFAVEEYAKVLSPGELKCFLDLKEGESPALPLDIEHLGK